MWAKMRHRCWLGLRLRVRLRVRVRVRVRVSWLRLRLRVSWLGLRVGVSWLGLRVRVRAWSTGSVVGDQSCSAMAAAFGQMVGSILDPGAKAEFHMHASPPSTFSRSFLFVFLVFEYNDKDNVTMIRAPFG